MKKICLFFFTSCFLFFSLTAIAQIPSYVPTNGLVGWWGFNGNANDYSSTGNHGTVFGGVSPTTNRLNASNAAYYFDGTGFITLSSCPTTGTGDFTISAWLVSPDSTYDRNSILNYGSFVTRGQVMFAVQMPEGWLYSDLCNVVGPNSTVLVNDNTWHMATIRNLSGVFQIFVDGDTSGQPRTMSPNIVSCEQKDIGRIIKKNYTDTLYYTGKLDDVGIWNRALSQAEITALYTGVPVSVTNAGLSASLKIFPNPASGMLQITSEQPMSGSIELLHIDGQKVMERSVADQLSALMDVSHLANGIYLLRMKNDNAVILKKVAIRH